MQEPLINKEMINYFKTAKVDLTGKGDPKALIAQLKKSLTHLDKLAISVLHYIFIHAKKVADAEGDLNNVAFWNDKGLLLITCKFTEIMQKNIFLWQNIMS